MYLKAVCPACHIELIHNIDIYNRGGEGVSAMASIEETWVLREFVSARVLEISSMLPVSLKHVSKLLRREGLGNLAEEIIEEVKVNAGAYEQKGILRSA